MAHVSGSPLGSDTDQVSATSDGAGPMPPLTTNDEMVGAVGVAMVVVVVVDPGVGVGVQAEMIAARPLD